MWHVTFLHAGLLTLAAAAVLPVIIHLFSRQRPRMVRFSAVRFVQSSRRKSIRRTRFRHLILLLMRVAVVALFAALVARPIAHRGSAAAGEAGAEGTPAVVLILDDSLSMRYRAGDSTWFEHARNAALEVADRLPEGVAAAVVTTSGPAGRLTRPATNLPGRILGLKAGTASGPCWTALQNAAEMLHRPGISHRDVFLFTDMTSSAWLGYQHRELKLGDDVNLWIVDCARGPAANGAVTEVRDAGEPAIVGGMLRLRVRLAASGAPLARTVQFEYDGAAVARREVELGAEEEAEVDFGVLLSESGHHWGRVAFLNADGLPEDDARTFVLDVAPDVSVLCVEDDPAAGTESPAYFFRLALDPWQEEGRGLFRVRRASPAELESVSLAPFDVVALVGAGGMSDGAWERLAAYRSGGGGLLVFLGPETADAYRGAGARAVLPVEVGEPVAAPPDSPFLLRTVSTQHPFVRALASSGAARAQVRCRQCRRVTPGAAAQELLSFGPELPALVVHQAGGRAAVFASTADERWGDFAKTEPFVPFCHELVLHLAARVAGGLRSMATGAQVPITFETSRWPTSVSVTPPGSAEPERLLPGTIPGKLTYWHTDAPGYYRVDFERRDREWTGGFALNTAPVEGALRKVALEDLADVLQAGSVRLLADPARAQVGTRGGRGGAELAPFLVLLVLALLAAEGLLANRFYGWRTAPSGGDAGGGA